MRDTNALLPDIKLRFNIEHPNFEDCYAFGYECAKNELSEEENPFTQGTAESEQWLEGWWDGFYGQEPLYAEYKNPEDSILAANDEGYPEHNHKFAIALFEITGVIAISALLGFYLVDLVA